MNLELGWLMTFKLRILENSSLQAQWSLFWDRVSGLDCWWNPSSLSLLTRFSLPLAVPCWLNSPMTVKLQFPHVLIPILSSVPSMEPDMPGPALPLLRSYSFGQPCSQCSSLLSDPLTQMGCVCVCLLPQHCLLLSSSKSSPSSNSAFPRHFPAKTETKE